MRIAFLGDASLDHIRRWVGHFAGGGHDVLLVSFERTDGCPFPTVRLHKRLPTKLAGYLAALPRLRRLLAEFNPDLVNALYVTGYGLLGALSGYRPFVVTALGSDLLVDYPSSPVHRFQVKRALGRADLVTVDAGVLSEVARSAGAAANNIETVYFGIDDTVFHPGRETGSGAEREGPATIVSTRNLHPVYDLDTLIDAAPAILSRTDARLLICGDGPQRQRLEESVARRGIGGRVTFSGRLTPQGIAERLRSADCYVSTSRSDSTSVSLLEAMACGVPPVVTDLPANREWIENGPGGLLFPAGEAGALAEAVTTMLEKKELAAAVRKRNLGIIAARGLWRQNMERLEERFRGLTGRTRES